ncbi:hypothetical protein PILCRDRAFT_602886 [Piloderma croceum F 1598]|uniref:CFEM domain-containing protein n=1 Tax=Piloderma croceum (strain F 1598) TaxID=765440 RepID=A0A0C3BL79_PILCF|nr:hypothetical protein PILCRDRAFT_602886 [Piloderma croceum F 1598]
MIANLKLLALIFVAALAVNAASSSSTNTSTAPVPSSTAAIPACVANCLGNATSSAPGGCTSPTNVTCVCTSTEFQEAAQKCLKANCSAADQATANALGQSQCPNS